MKLHLTGALMILVATFLLFALLVFILP